MEINPYKNQEPIISPLENNDTLHMESIKENKFAVIRNDIHFDFMAEQILVDTSTVLETETEFQEKIRKSYKEKVAKLMSAKFKGNNIEITISFEENAGKEDFYFSHSYSISRELFEAYVFVISNNIKAKERFKQDTPAHSAKKYTVRSSKNVH